jgi:hypothetical protein
MDDRRRTVIGRVKLLIVALGFVLHLPLIGGVLARGLDNSWIYAINSLRYLNLCCGRDIAFTYGPFGYLLCPLPIGSNLEQGFWAVVAMCLLFSLLLGWLALRNLSMAETVAFVLLSLLVIPRLPTMALMNVILLCGLALQVRRHRIWLVVGATTLAVLLLFIKFSLGISAGGICFVMMLMLAGELDWRQWLRLCAVAGGVALVLALVIAARYLGGIWYLGQWLRGSLALSSGYSTALSLAGSGRALGAAMFLLGVYVGGLLFGWLRWRKTTVVALLAPALFILFKNGFVRGDASHYNEFFTMSLGLVCAVMAVSRSRREFYLAGAIWIAALLALLAGHSDPAVFFRAAVARPGDIRQVCQLGQRKADLLRASRRNLVELKLPEEFVSQVAAKGWSVDAMPMEIMPLAANDLHWRPAPVLQLYMTFTSYLDDLCAEHYAGQHAADILLFKYAVVDRRNLWWDSPAAWCSILKNYE